MAPRRQRPVALLRSFFPTHWQMRRRYRLPSGDAAQPYYIYYPSGLVADQPWPEVVFDPQGVATTVEGYNPVTIAQYALYSHERLSRRVEGSREAFLSQVAYLRDTQRCDGAYPYTVGDPDYGVEPGFLSAMAQGLAASVLARAFVLTNDPRNRDAAARALRPLKTDAAAGGASFIRGRDAFFEEVASERPCHILNGHLFAAFGIYDAGQIGLVDSELEELHAAAVDTLERWLPLYDSRGWSYYHLAVREKNVRHYAHMSYHQLHIAQLRVYAAMTGRSVFAAYADRWERGMAALPVRARVWADSSMWLTEVLRERTGLIRRSAWRPIHPVAAVT